MPANRAKIQPGWHTSPVWVTAPRVGLGWVGLFLQYLKQVLKSFYVVADHDAVHHVAVTHVPVHRIPVHRVAAVTIR